MQVPIACVPVAIPSANDVSGFCGRHEVSGQVFVFECNEF